MKKLSLDWLKQNCQLIHYFGLGFIQLKMNARERIHFYTDKLPKTAKNEEIHNHRRNFSSQIIAGTLKQDIYEIPQILRPDKDYSHLLQIVSCNPNKKGKIEHEEFLDIEKVFSREYKKGESYYIDHNTFHIVESNNAVTIITQSNYQKDYAEVIRPRGQDLVCPFSVKIPEEKLWNIVEDMIPF